MGAEFLATKLVVADVEQAERFYAALGLKVISRRVGTGDRLRQQQCWMSTTGSSDAHPIILSQFLELPPPPPPTFPGEIWLAFRVDDLDATIEMAVANGGKVEVVATDKPESGIRSAVVSDPEGHAIELVGPLAAG